MWLFSNVFCSESVSYFTRVSSYYHWISYIINTHTPNTPTQYQRQGQRQGQGQGGHHGHEKDLYVNWGYANSMDDRKPKVRQSLQYVCDSRLNEMNEQPVYECETFLFDWNFSSNFEVLQQ